MGDIHDWRCVSQHYCQSLVEQAVEKQDLHVKFNPSMLMAVTEDGLTVAHLLKRVLMLKTGAAQGPVIITPTFEVYDEDMNPYQAHRSSGEGLVLEGQRILLVDKVDETRASMAHFLGNLQGRIELQRTTAAGRDWKDPEIGVFVLHNKKKVKAADLPPEMLEGRYFAAEESDNVAISFPFSVTPSAGYTQPSQHGDHHPHRPSSRNSAPGSRKSIEERRIHTTPSPKPGSTDTRLLSSHYVEETIEKAVDEQQLMDKFPPTLIIAVSDDALALARFIRGYIRFKGSSEVTILSSRLLEYDESAVYHPLGAAWDITALQGHRILLIDKVASTRVTLCEFIGRLRTALAGAEQQQQAAGAAWTNPTLGVFVLQSRDNSCTAQLPADIMDGKFFVAEHIGDVRIAFPFHVDSQGPGAVPMQA